jgi:hypothetical protein
MHITHNAGEFFSMPLSLHLYQSAYIYDYNETTCIHYNARLLMSSLRLDVIDFGGAPKKGESKAIQTNQKIDFSFIRCLLNTVTGSTFALDFPKRN